MFRPAVRFLAILLGVSAFTLAVAGIISTKWLDSWNNTTDTHNYHQGLFDWCQRVSTVNVPYSLTAVAAPESHDQCCEST